MIYVMLLFFQLHFLPCVPALFLHEYQEIGDDITLYFLLFFSTSFSLDG